MSHSLLADSTHGSKIAVGWADIVNPKLYRGHGGSAYDF